MAISPEEWKRKRYEGAQKRKEKEARQRKWALRLAIAVAVLLLCGVVVLVATSGEGKPSADIPATQPTSENQETLEVTDAAETSGESQSPEQTEEDTGSTVIHVVAGGDVNVTDKVVSAGGLAYDYTHTFMDVAYLFGDADLAVVNLEGNLCGVPYGSSTVSAPQELMNALDNAGVDLVQLANSYSISKGLSGLAMTINGVRSAGMEPLGVYANQEEFRKEKGYTLCTVQGVKIAFVAFTKGMDGMALPVGSENCVNLLYTDYDSSYQDVNREGITSILKAAQQENPDVIIALLHWGSEYNDTISRSQETIVELMQENGVDAIIGTHPHYVQQMTFDPEEGTFVAYSLGDLISDGERSGTQYSVVLDLEITKNNRNGKTSITGFSYTPIYTVAEKGEPLRVVRINEAIAGFESYFIGRVNEQTYAQMQYALQRIESRVSGQG